MEGEVRDGAWVGNGLDRDRTCTDEHRPVWGAVFASRVYAWRDCLLYAEEAASRKLRGTIRGERGRGKGTRHRNQPRCELARDRGKTGDRPAANVTLQRESRGIGGSHGSTESATEPVP